MLPGFLLGSYIVHGSIAQYCWQEWYCGPWDNSNSTLMLGILIDIINKHHDMSILGTESQPRLLMRNRIHLGTRLNWLEEPNTCNHPDNCKFEYAPRKKPGIFARWSMSLYRENNNKKKNNDKPRNAETIKEPKTSNLCSCTDAHICILPIDERIKWLKWYIELQTPLMCKPQKEKESSKVMTLRCIGMKHDNQTKPLS